MIALEVALYYIYIYISWKKKKIGLINVNTLFILIILDIFAYLA